MLVLVLVLIASLSLRDISHLLFLQIFPCFPGIPSSTIPLLLLLLFPQTARTSSLGRTWGFLIFGRTCSPRPVTIPAHRILAEAEPTTTTSPPSTPTSPGDRASLFGSLTSRLASFYEAAQNMAQSSRATTPARDRGVTPGREAPQQRGTTPGREQSHVLANAGRPRSLGWKMVKFPSCFVRLFQVSPPLTRVMFFCDFCGDVRGVRLYQ